jgi:hypothetical protein
MNTMAHTHQLTPLSYNTVAQTYHVFVPHHHTVEDIEDPNYWLDSRYQLKAGDYIQAVHEGFLWEATYIVISNQHRALVLRLKSFTHYGENEEDQLTLPEDCGLQITFSNIEKFSLVRTVGNYCLKSHFSTNNEAVGYALAYLNTIQAKKPRGRPPLVKE